MTAKTFFLSPPPIGAADLSASDIVAICSLAVAIAAVVMSKAAIAAQRRHNILSARPHFDIDLGVISYVLRLSNHGPGVGRLRAFTGIVDGRTFNFLKENDLHEFCEWLIVGMGSTRIKMRRNCFASGASVAPNLSAEILALDCELNKSDINLLGMRLKQVTYHLSFSCIYEKVYSDVHKPLLQD